MVAPDMQDFLRGYPLVTKNRWHQQNASFYANEQLATPSEWTIEDLLSRLRKDPSRFKNNQSAQSFNSLIVEDMAGERERLTHSRSPCHLLSVLRGNVRLNSLLGIAHCDCD